MQRQIRRLGLSFVGLFALLFAQVSYIQVFAADRIVAMPGNATRQIRAEFEVQRGAILAADRRTVLARSVEEPRRSVYRFRREYPHGELYAHITGFYSRIYGRAGIEQALNAYLAGTAPELAVSNVADLILGRPKQGATVYTTIVPRLQEAARRGLAGLRGAVAAVDPRTGDLLAAYSTPGFDPNDLSSGTDEEIRRAWARLVNDPQRPLTSKAMQDLYLPGSTFKLVTASAALEAGFGPESLWPNPRVLDLATTDDDLENFGGSLCAGGVARVSLRRAFQESCNVTFGEIGLELGAQALADQAIAYGFCPTLPPERTDCAEPAIDSPLPFENGRFPAPPYFERRVPAIAYSAVGLDNVLTNPLHLALIAGAIANGGDLMAPRVVTSVRDAQGRVVRSFDPEIAGRPISPTTARRMTDLMLAVTQGGTASSTFAGFPIPVAGKTGTATNGEGRPPNAWFAAFAPAGTAQTPRIAVAVIVLDGGDLGNEATGGRVAAPIARDLIAAYLGG